MPEMHYDSDSEGEIEGFPNVFDKNKAEGEWLIADDTDLQVLLKVIDMMIMIMEVVLMVIGLGMVVELMVVVVGMK